MIAIPKTSVSLQMGIAIPFNILVLYYYSKARPFSFKFKKYRIRNYFAIYHQSCLIIFEMLMLALGLIVEKGGSISEKEDFSYNIIYFLTVVCSISMFYHFFTIVVVIYRKIWLVIIETEIFKRNFPEKYAEYQAAKNKNKDVKLVKSIDPKAKDALKKMVRDYKKIKSILRPTEKDKQNPQLPIKYKITYFEKTESSSASSKTTLSKAQKKQMLR